MSKSILLLLVANRREREREKVDRGRAVGYGGQNHPDQ